MKMYVSKKIIFNIIILGFLSSLLVIIPLNNNNNLGQKFQSGAALRLSNGPVLLHTYDFEDQVIGKNPTYETFDINEAAGNVFIDNFSEYKINIWHYRK
ncbi:MAG: hypothetical protein ACFFEN_15135 [Candidatus Thorarchaeota archaeon]